MKRTYSKRTGTVNSVMTRRGINEEPLIDNIETALELLEARGIPLVCFIGYLRGIGLDKYSMQTLIHLENLTQWGGGVRNWIDTLEALEYLGCIQPVISS